MSASAPGRGARRLVTLLVATLGLLLGTGTAAVAHPFGDPQTVTIGAEADAVSVVWRVGADDDLTLLGVELGVLPEDRLMLDGAITFEDGDAEAVADSEELRDYLLERIEVSAAGDACTGTVVDVGDLTGDGARLEYACPAAVDAASVRVRTLTDLHPAYRTLATGPRGQRTVYETGADTFEWALGSGDAGGAEAAPRAATDDDLGRSAALQLGAVLGVVLLVAVGGALLLRRRRTQLPPTTPTSRRS